MTDSQFNALVAEKVAGYKIAVGPEWPENLFMWAPLSGYLTKSGEDSEIAITVPDYLHDANRVVELLEASPFAIKEMFCRTDVEPIFWGMALFRKHNSRGGYDYHVQSRTFCRAALLVLLKSEGVDIEGESVRVGQQEQQLLDGYPKS
jgi:hypothetical protein